MGVGAAWKVGQEHAVENMHGVSEQSMENSRDPYGFVMQGRSFCTESLNEATVCNTIMVSEKKDIYKTMQSFVSKTKEDALMQMLSATALYQNVFVQVVSNSKTSANPHVI